MKFYLEKPFSLNPKTGYVISANHKIPDDDYKHYLVKNILIFFLFFLY